MSIWTITALTMLDPIRLPLRAAAKTWLRRRLERRATLRFRRFWFVTDRDAVRLAHLPGGVLRNTPRFPVRAPDFHSTGATILFVGSLWYAPNKFGLERFLKSVWPRVLEAVPNAELELVGDVPPDERKKVEA